jgi:hypothetical protein
MRKFFSIETTDYQFEIWDITSLLTVLNVVLIIAGWYFAPVFGLANCFLCLVINIKSRAHINSYATQLMLVILNIYFLI